MKINYIDKPNYTTLRYIEDGGVFCPSNSAIVYLKTDLNAMSDAFTDSKSCIKDFYRDLQNLSFYDCEDLIACVALQDGEFVFLHRDLKVEKLDCVLDIKGD